MVDIAKQIMFWRDNLKNFGYGVDVKDLVPAIERGRDDACGNN